MKIHIFKYFQAIKLDKLPLLDLISIDEVHVDLDEYCKYALIIQNFYTEEPIDLLQSRRQNVTEPYFVPFPAKNQMGAGLNLDNQIDKYLHSRNLIFIDFVADTGTLNIFKQNFYTQPKIIPYKILFLYINRTDIYSVCPIYLRC